MKRSSCDIKKCNAWCCRYVIMHYPYFIDAATALLFSLRKIIVHNQTLFVPCRCKWLNNHNRCSFYTQRPQVCKDFDCKSIKIPPGLLNNDGEKDTLETETTSAFCVARRTVAFREKRKGKNTNR